MDDSKLQRRLLSVALRKRGFDVVEAGSAEEGFLVFETHAIDIVISDWVMPGMNGPAFCEKLRAFSRDRYIYIILLTAKSASSEIAEGFDAGADDFLSKPVNSIELAARMGAGQRILHFERELKRANGLLTDTLGELQTLYNALDSDLAEAQKLQQSLVRDKYGRFGATEIAIFLESSGHVGGDLVGFFPINDTEVCAYAIDVSGHGVSSALMTARLAGVFSGQTPGKNLAIRDNHHGGVTARSPSSIAADLNTLLLEEMETEHYFTMFLCVLDTSIGRMQFVHAGHPHAVLLQGDGGCQLLGQGGFPIGMLPFAQYFTDTIDLSPGDRVLLLSDGMTECTDSAGNMLEETGLAHIAARLPHSDPEMYLAQLFEALAQFSGRRQFDDDVSAVLVDFNF
ncbi:MAG: SpoIIE family protein phosphatase [Dinoroseobacter sp.]|nr:SpoIIE family protein phosphatase [Dinoroseobacter sp.]